MTMIVILDIPGIQRVMLPPAIKKIMPKGADILPSHILVSREV
jgi:hypothetical protein